VCKGIFLLNHCGVEETITIVYALLKLELFEFLPINHEQKTGSGFRKQVSHYNS
jgi:hypothetical protein